MRSRILHILMLLWLATWFVVVVPLHQRGAIARPGMGGTKGDSCCSKSSESAKVVEAELRSCHTTNATAAAKQTEKPSKGDPVQRCAVCYIVATSTPPVFIDITVPELGLLEEIALLSPVHRIITAEFWPVVLGRAPPFLA